MLEVFAAHDDGTTAEERAIAFADAAEAHFLVDDIRQVDARDLYAYQGEWFRAQRAVADE